MVSSLGHAQNVAIYSAPSTTTVAVIAAVSGAHLRRVWCVGSDISPSDLETSTQRLQATSTADVTQVDSLADIDEAIDLDLVIFDATHAPTDVAALTDITAGGADAIDRFVAQGRGRLLIAMSPNDAGTAQGAAASAGAVAWAQHLAQALDERAIALVVAELGSESSPATIAAAADAVRVNRSAILLADEQRRMGRRRLPWQRSRRAQDDSPNGE